MIVSGYWLLDDLTYTELSLLFYLLISAIRNILTNYIIVFLWITV